MPRLLVIKTSSMGDLVHCLSAVAEAKHAVPNLSVDWVAEETFVEIPELYPGVDRVFPVAFRRWKGRYRDPAVREELSAAIHRFRHVEEPYDLVIDAQGLIKSAVLSLRSGVARRRRWCFNWASAREPLASLAAGQTVHSPPEVHAVERLRTLFSTALGYELRHRPVTGHHLAAAMLGTSFKALCSRMGQDPESASRWVLLVHNTSRPEKLWPEVHWQALGKTMAELGWVPLFPAGNEMERGRARALAETTGGVALPACSLTEMAAIIQHAQLVVGLDTGLTHWAAALGRPTIGVLTGTPSGRYGLDWAVKSHTIEGDEIFADRVLAQARRWGLL